jgi:hypothetical protein
MEDGSSSNRRSRGIEVEDEDEHHGSVNILDQILGRGPGGRVSLSDSEDLSGSNEDAPASPPPAGKGKEVVKPTRKRHRIRRHRNRRAPEGFMAAARRAHGPLSPPLTPPHLRSSSSAHPARPVGAPDEDGFF